MDKKELGFFRKLFKLDYTNFGINKKVAESIYIKILKQIKKDK